MRHWCCCFFTNSPPLPPITFPTQLTRTLWQCVPAPGCSLGWAAARRPQRNPAPWTHRCHRLRPGWTPVWRCEGFENTASLAATPGSRCSGSNSSHCRQRRRGVDDVKDRGRLENEKPCKVCFFWGKKCQVLITSAFTESHVEKMLLEVSEDNNGQPLSWANVEL